jgi:hypothetical protein
MLISTLFLQIDLWPCQKEMFSLKCDGVQINLVLVLDEVMGVGCGGGNVGARGAQYKPSI